MKPEFTQNGVEVQSFDEILSELIDDYKAIYGDDIDLSQDTQDGQRVGIEARLSLDLQAYLSSVYNVLDPDLSSGELLRKVIKIAGIAPVAATRSTVEVLIEVNQITVLPVGFSVSGDAVWTLANETTIPIGTTGVIFEAEKFGAIKADANTINTIVSGDDLSIISVNNASAAVSGLNAEKDEELRKRRRKSVENPAYSTVGSLYAKLANLTGVSGAVVYENKSGVVDVGLSLDAHSLWCIVEGGDDSAIAEIIAKNTTGCNLKGALSRSFVETFTKPDASKLHYTHVVNFDRPTVVDLDITMTIHKNTAFSIVDEELIKQGIAEKVYDIGAAASSSELYAFAHKNSGDYYFSALELNGVDKIEGVSDTRFNISSDDIVLTIA